MALEFDKGPTKAISKLFAEHPDYSPVKDWFWFDWGPVFYRGRIDKSAKILCVASDPASTERIAGRALVGNAGQRLQGFLSKIGITKSYICLNGFIYALHPSHLSDGMTLLADPAHTAWRNSVFSATIGSKLQAIVAFGDVAKKAVDLWDERGTVPVFKTFHPNYRGSVANIVAGWNDVITALRSIVTKDKDGDNTLPLYGSKFEESDYARIPRRDLPFGAADFLGDDSWVRTGSTGGMDSVRRDSNDSHRIIWEAPQS
jgi:hypothetical protein